VCGRIINLHVYHNTDFPPGCVSGLYHGRLQLVMPASETKMPLAPFNACDYGAVMCPSVEEVCALASAIHGSTRQTWAVVLLEPGRECQRYDSRWKCQGRAQGNGNGIVKPMCGAGCSLTHCWRHILRISRAWHYAQGAYDESQPESADWNGKRTTG
jgi:hypothetical protein